jgi:aminoglycoside/choline kinase family phosphotransferase
MIKVTKEEWEAMEAEIESYQKRLIEIEKEMDMDWDLDNENEGYVRLMQNEEYRKIEDMINTNLRTQRRCFVSEGFHDDPSMDYQITEMKSLK